MKKMSLIVAVILGSLISSAQSFNMRLDHNTILVRDIEKSREFYKNIMHFKEKETPWGDELPRPVLFFDIGNNQELHVTEDKKESIKLNKILHMAFTVKDFDGYLKFLNEKGIRYGDWSGKNGKFQTRIDGVRQIYFQDPDGYWIEINDNSND